MMYSKSFVTIAQILDSAQQLFVNKSYDDITMTEIARQADVTKGAIYHHFTSKEALFLCMMERYLEKLQQRLQPSVDQLGTARERLAFLTALYFDMPFEEQRVVQLVRRESNRFRGETRNKLVAAYQQALPDQIEAIMTDGIATGEIMMGDPRLLTWQFIAIVETSLTGYARQQFADGCAMAIYLTNMFLDGAGSHSEHSAM